MHIRCCHRHRNFMSLDYNIMTCSFSFRIPDGALHFGDEVGSCKFAGGVVGSAAELTFTLTVDVQVDIELLYHSNREA